ncbi:hypothetical protein CO666_03960 [Rhizobium chutanense]|uniref:Uncharacterized protein n=1 Tax=Rhizobium chutanense TaxID=2035448 RepID=A0A2A6JHD1_9HYPH|nr:hypothetical protein CO666_03960 [Rhizobium chutanense]
MPLTLTLSPSKTGRGDLPNAASRVDEAGATYPFSPRAGRRCRQADEGLRQIRSQGTQICRT